MYYYLGVHFVWIIKDSRLLCTSLSHEDGKLILCLTIRDLR